MRRVSEQKSEELARVKHERDEARMKRRRGRMDHLKGNDSDLAKAFRAGTLTKEMERKEEAFGHRQQVGVARLLNWPVEDFETSITEGLAS